MAKTFQFDDSLPMAKALHEALIILEQTYTVKKCDTVGVDIEHKIFDKSSGAEIATITSLIPPLSTPDLSSPRPGELSIKGTSTNGHARAYQTIESIFKKYAERHGGKVKSGPDLP